MFTAPFQGATRVFSTLLRRTPEQRRLQGPGLKPGKVHDRGRVKPGREDRPIPQGRGVLRDVLRSGQMCGRYLDGIGWLPVDNELPCHLAEGNQVAFRRDALAAKPDDAGNLLILFQVISHVQRGARELAPRNLDFLLQSNGG